MSILVSIKQETSIGLKRSTLTINIERERRERERERERESAIWPSLKRENI